MHKGFVHSISSHLHLWPGAHSYTLLTWSSQEWTNSSERWEYDDTV